MCAGSTRRIPTEKEATDGPNRRWPSRLDTAIQPQTDLVPERLLEKLEVARAGDVGDVASRLARIKKAASRKADRAGQTYRRNRASSPLRR